MGAGRLPKSRDVVVSSWEKESFTSSFRKAGLRHADVVRPPMSGVLFFFLVEGGFYFLL